MQEDSLLKRHRKVILKNLKKFCKDRFEGPICIPIEWGFSAVYSLCSSFGLCVWMHGRKVSVHKNASNSLELGAFGSRGEFNEFGSTLSSPTLHGKWSVKRKGKNGNWSCEDELMRAMSQ